MAVRIYLLSLKLITPALISRPSVGNVIEHMGGYIPGSTLRGALLALALKRKSGALARELEEPKLVFGPAFPYYRGELYKPSHPFIYCCKVCRSAMDCLSELVAYKKFGSPGLPENVPPKACREGHVAAMTSLGGRLLNAKHENCGVPRYMRVESVAMNKSLKSAEPTMLYSYVCLAPGQEFRAVLASEDNRLEELGLVGDYEVRLGRGLSRGLGYAQVRLEEDPDYLARLSDRIGEKLSTTSPYVFVLALSPVAPVLGNSSPLQLAPLINGLKLKEMWIVGTSRFSGFSLSTNTPKASIMCASPGSLYMYSSEARDRGKLIETLARASVLGQGAFAHLGLNLVEVLGV